MRPRGRGWRRRAVAGRRVPLRRPLSRARLVPGSSRRHRRQQNDDGNNNINNPQNDDVPLGPRRLRVAYFPHEPSARAGGRAGPRARRGGRGKGARAPRGARGRRTDSGARQRRRPLRAGLPGPVAERARGAPAGLLAGTLGAAVADRRGQRPALWRRRAARRARGAAGAQRGAAGGQRLYWGGAGGVVRLASRGDVRGARQPGTLR